MNKRSELDIHLDGRGVVPQPSLFACNDITLMDLPREPIVLVYPVSQRLGWLDPASAGASLEDLLSRTRAAMLDCLADPSCTHERTGPALGHLPGVNQRADEDPARRRPDRQRPRRPTSSPHRPGTRPGLLSQSA
ncbi:hypothetical protein [Kribbella soli]|uniref:hypothetical protein n=1 Tax=Kribbella soli TaxID=1124743 RepID=UPI001EDCCA2C|nr:hypothetical protein [Kribbella soli]